MCIPFARFVQPGNIRDKSEVLRKVRENEGISGSIVI